MWIEWHTCRWWHIPLHTQSMCHYSMPVKLSVGDIAVQSVHTWLRCCHDMQSFLTVNQTRKQAVKTLIQQSKDTFVWVWRMKTMPNVTYVWNSIQIDSVSGPDLLSPYLQRPLYCPLVQIKLNSEKKKMTTLSKKIPLNWEASFFQQKAFLVDCSRIVHDTFFLPTVNTIMRFTNQNLWTLYRKLIRPLGCSLSLCKLKPSLGCQCARGWCH